MGGGVAAMELLWWSCYDIRERELRKVFKVLKRPIKSRVLLKRYTLSKTT